MRCRWMDRTANILVVLLLAIIIVSLSSDAVTADEEDFSGIDFVASNGHRFVVAPDFTYVQHKPDGTISEGTFTNLDGLRNYLSFSQTMTYETSAEVFGLDSEPIDQVVGDRETRVTEERHDEAAAAQPSSTNGDSPEEPPEQQQFEFQRTQIHTHDGQNYIVKNPGDEPLIGTGTSKSEAFQSLIDDGDLIPNDARPQQLTFDELYSIQDVARKDLIDRGITNPTRSEVDARAEEIINYPFNDEGTTIEDIIQEWFGRRERPDSFSINTPPLSEDFVKTRSDVPQTEIRGVSDEDNLDTLAIRYSTTPDELRRLNPFEDLENLDNRFVNLRVPKIPIILPHEIKSESIEHRTSQGWFRRDAVRTYNPTNNYIIIEEINEEGVLEIRAFQVFENELGDGFSYQLEDGTIVDVGPRRQIGGFADLVESQRQTAPPPPYQRTFNTERFSLENGILTDTVTGNRYALGDGITNTEELYDAYIDSLEGDDKDRFKVLSDNQRAAEVLRKSLELGRIKHDISFRDAFGSLFSSFMSANTPSTVTSLFYKDEIGERQREAREKMIEWGSPRSRFDDMVCGSKIPPSGDGFAFIEDLDRTGIEVVVHVAGERTPLTIYNETETGDVETLGRHMYRLTASVTNKFLENRSITFNVYVGTSGNRLQTKMYNDSIKVDKGRSWSLPASDAHQISENYYEYICINFKGRRPYVGSLGNLKPIENPFCGRIEESSRTATPYQRPSYLSDSDASSSGGSGSGTQSANPI